MFRSLYEPLSHTANESGDQVAWIVPQNGSIRSIRWSELRLDVDRLACWLESNGVKPQDRVVNTEPNSLGWAILDLACAAIGAIHAPIDPPLVRTAKGPSDRIARASRRFRYRASDDRDGSGTSHLDAQGLATVAMARGGPNRSDGQHPLDLGNLGSA